MAPARTRKSTPAKPAEPKAAEPKVETPPAAPAAPKVEVTPAPEVTVTPATGTRDTAEHERAASLRAQHVEGLRNELAFLERQPKPNEKRIADVKKTIAHYSSKPADRTIETA